MAKAKNDTQTYRLLKGKHVTRSKEGVVTVANAGDNVTLTDARAKRMGARISAPVGGAPGQYAAEVEQVTTNASAGDADEGKVETGPPGGVSTGEAFGVDGRTPAQKDALAKAQAAKASAAGKKG